MVEKLDVDVSSVVLGCNTHELAKVKPYTCCIVIISNGGQLRSKC